ncbi:hypothetical protein ACIBSV_37360 [Embleya sp. NPDC050154]|uniref:ATP-dependent DNA ligase n=1 Tax=Embleya sp. NPDC050154 TaxID=3363988 RepID=UPI0037985F38
MTITVPSDPILAAQVESLPHAGVFEPKWDGFRSWVARPTGGPARVVSRRGTDLSDAFADIARAADRDLPDVDVLLDGELVVWHDGKLAFDLLQRRMNRTRAEFLEFVTDPRYGWPETCRERVGAVPRQLLHEWNTVRHGSDFEGRPERRPLSYDEVQALFDVRTDGSSPFARPVARARWPRTGTRCC